MATTADPKHTNRLIHETSPYLLQHAHNPVAWYPWGAEALDRARLEDKLILLSIGYSACHWCHVMERESFEDEKIAAIMNEHFVNIKVDREERPDLDDIYMAATIAMNYGQGGWPMTVFITPDLEPVFAGTYFPPEDRYGRPGFATLLTSIARAWREDREQLLETATQLVAHLREQQDPGQALTVGEEELRAALSQFAEDFDSTHGGFGSEPKFPPATALSLLLRLHRRFDDPQARLMVQKTLYAMGQGGIYDQIGGGFHRYATDRRWLVPHFEKMLYDNALLTKVYLEAYQVSGDPFYRRIASEVLDYLLRDMTAPDGGFYSSTDADSEGEEGKFFVWKPEEIVAVLGEEEGRRFAAYYDITPRGNWEGTNIPNTPRSVAAVAQELGITPPDLERSLDAARPRMFQDRANRTPPGLDDKILTAWNGLAIGAFADGYRVLGERRYLDAAANAAAFIRARLQDEYQRLLRTFGKGRAHLAAVLEDYAYLAEGLIDLYEACGDTTHLTEAARLLEIVLSEFADPDTGAFFSTGHHHEQLIIRQRDGTDGATPSANAVTAAALARLSFHLGRDDLREAAVAAIRAFGRSVRRHPRAFAKSLIVVDFLLDGPIELAIIGHEGNKDRDALCREVAKHYLPNRIQAIHDPTRAEGGDELPLVTGKSLVEGRAALYVCRDYACRKPITDPAQVANALAAQRDIASGPKTIATPLAGRATGEGTSRYAARYDGHRFERLGRTDLVSGRVGFGGYRVHDDVDEHREALTRSLLAGANLIDTSTNYADGGSERLVGSVLRSLVDAGEIARDEVIVVSKIGYVQGQNFELAAAREAHGDPFPEMVKMEDGLWHCIHPDFLRDQLQRALDRLEMETLDVCLLHNPEYFLMHAAREGRPLPDARHEFDRRLEQAFSFFEEAVREGLVGCYGVSSNTVTAPTTRPDATALPMMLEAAVRAGGNQNRFAVLQLPLNLLESDAVLEPNCGPDASHSVLEVARETGVAVLVNRPLNAFARSALVRLADVQVDDEAIDFDAQATRVAGLEKAYREAIAPHIRVRGDAVDAADFFRWSDHLLAARPRIQSLEQWAQVVGQITGRVRQLASLLDQHLEGEVATHWAAWREQYLPELESLMRELRRETAERAHRQSVAVSAAIDSLLPAKRRKVPLSQKALWVVASTPGVSCVLVGMRRVEYVEDALTITTWPPLGDVVPVYRAATGLA